MVFGTSLSVFATGYIRAFNDAVVLRFYADSLMRDGAQGENQTTVRVSVGSPYKLLPCFLDKAHAVLTTDKLACGSGLTICLDK